MRKSSPWPATLKVLFRIVLKCRRIFPRRNCEAFGAITAKEIPRIQRIYVINLNRHQARWIELEYQLKQVLDYSGVSVWNLTKRHIAVDAAKLLEDSRVDVDVNPVYALADQLYVEPQPLALPTQMDLNAPIQMSRPEIAVALSHIAVWRQLAASTEEYALILEDDVWFQPRFTKNLNEAWTEIQVGSGVEENFDIFYLSYEEVKHGAPKTFLSSKIFRPVRGLWNLSGYVVSRKGANKLLALLPCRGPIDLWINHQFNFLDVRAIKKSVIGQRPDFTSSNSYSILPSLTKIGAITSEHASLFHARPTECPVFAFGPKNSGLTSVAMALSMLGYTCCSDLQELPSLELDMLLSAEAGRIFNAYVNIGTLESEIQNIKRLYPKAKFIYATSKSSVVSEKNFKIFDDLKDTDLATINIDASNKWQIISEHLRCAPPMCSFPELIDMEQRELIAERIDLDEAFRSEIPKRDKSPWIIGTEQSWNGINSSQIEFAVSAGRFTPIKIQDDLSIIYTKYWLPREDTFTDNLALFRPSNIEFISELGVALTVKKEALGFREYSAAALTSSNQYLYGRFDIIFKVSNAPGVVTGFFLHRDSPRQEIDIEIAGHRTDRLVVNVFYNPGAEGAKYDYGYRGAPTYIDLGFDASESYHQYSIEWGPGEIRWFVDNRLVHRRLNWNPTPVPHLPMSLHANVWPCRSRELAGRLVNSRLPTKTFIKSISLEANQRRILTLL